MRHYVNPSTMYAVGITMPIICTGATIARFLSRKYMKVAYGADDWTAVAALILIISCGTILIAGDATHTLGWDSQSAVEAGNTEHPRYKLDNKFQYAFNIISIVTIGLIRLAIGLLYRRIFREPIVRAVNWTVMGIVVCWTVAFSLMFFFACGTDISANFAPPDVADQHCRIYSFVPLASMAITDSIIDVMLLLIPIVPVWRLRMPMSRKISVLLLFAIGVFSIAASMTRMVLAIEVLIAGDWSKHNFGNAQVNDVLGIISIGLWWTMIEMSIGCLVANLPAVGLLRERTNNPVRKFLYRIFPTKRSNSNVSGASRNSGVSLSTQDLEARKVSGYTSSTSKSNSTGQKMPWDELDDFDFDFEEPASIPQAHTAGRGVLR